GWLKSHEDLPLIPSKKLKVSIPEFELARLCPECRRILVKYKVGQNIPFLIDRCGQCAGIWLDKGEWEILKRRNLHDDLQKIFTDHWQEEVKKGETRTNLAKMY
ncbi:MAG: zf-TFIIB domain-containing protein, partial [Acidobacteriota bacterium]